jgi:hypothetical protein
MKCNMEILLIVWSRYGDVGFGLAMFYNSCLLYDSVVAFCAYDVLDVSGVTVWLTGLNKW